MINVNSIVLVYDSISDIGVHGGIVCLLWKAVPVVVSSIT